MIRRCGLIGEVVSLEVSKSYAIPHLSLSLSLSVSYLRIKMYAFSYCFSVMLACPSIGMFSNRVSVYDNMVMIITLWSHGPRIKYFLR